MANLARHGRAVIHYDQLGCGRSTHLPDATRAFWSVELFVDELRNRRQCARHRGPVPPARASPGAGCSGRSSSSPTRTGMQSLTICDSPASMPLWLEAANDRCAAGCPVDVQQTLTRHEEAGTTDSPEYLAAMQVFYDRHVCRVTPNPPEVLDSFAQIEQDPTVYHTMNGP